MCGMRRSVFLFGSSSCGGKNYSFKESVKMASKKVAPAAAATEHFTIYNLEIRVPGKGEETRAKIEKLLGAKRNGVLTISDSRTFEGKIPQ